MDITVYARHVGDTTNIFYRDGDRIVELSVDIPPDRQPTATILSDNILQPDGTLIPLPGSEISQGNVSEVIQTLQHMTVVEGIEKPSDIVKNEEKATDASGKES